MALRRVPSIETPTAVNHHQSIVRKISFRECYSVRRSVRLERFLLRSFASESASRFDELNETTGVEASEFANNLAVRVPSTMVDRWWVWWWSFTGLMPGRGPESPDPALIVRCSLYLNNFPFPVGKAHPL